MPVRDLASAGSISRMSLPETLRPVIRAARQNKPEGVERIRAWCRLIGIDAEGKPNGHHLCRLLRAEYRLALEDRDMEVSAFIDLLGRWLDAYPIASIEDPVDEDDREAMVEFTRRFGRRVQIIGDDYLVTNAALVRQAAEDGACNAVLVKVNQAGTVSEALATIDAAQAAGYR